MGKHRRWNLRRGRLRTVGRGRTGRRRHPVPGALPAYYQAGLRVVEVLVQTVLARRDMRHEQGIHLSGDELLCLRCRI